MANWTSFSEESLKTIEVEISETRRVVFVVDPVGTLGLIKNFGDRVDVYIPSVLPDGTQIKAIAADFCCGLFGTITISDDIAEINEAAFRSAKVREVVWPAACTEIPNICFFMSDVRRIHNLNRITSIGSYAFLSAFALNEIDLSDAPIVSIAPNGLDASCHIHLPYYFSRDDENE